MCALYPPEEPGVDQAFALWMAERRWTARRAKECPSGISL